MMAIPTRARNYLDTTVTDTTDYNYDGGTTYDHSGMEKLIFTGRRNTTTKKKPSGQRICIQPAAEIIEMKNNYRHFNQNITLNPKHSYITPKIRNTLFSQKLFKERNNGLVGIN